MNLELYEKCVETESWDHLMLSVSPLSRTVILALGKKVMNSQMISGVTGEPQKSVNTILNRLTGQGILVRQGRGSFAVSNHSLASYAELNGWTVTKQEACVRAENIVYAELAPFLEALEHKRLIRGNGHHLAQNFAREISAKVESRWVGK